MNIAIDHTDVRVEIGAGTATVSFVAADIDTNAVRAIYRFDCVIVSRHGAGVVRGSGMMTSSINAPFDPAAAAKMVAEHLLTERVVPTRRSNAAGSDDDAWHRRALPRIA